MKPEAGQFWEVTAGTGTGHVIEVVKVEDKDPINRPYAVVKPLGGLASSETRIPLDERWETGMQIVNTCPVCEQPLPGPHLGTCRYSMMHTGKPELQSEVPPRPSSSDSSVGATSLGDRIRALTDNAKLYREADETAEQIIATAAEIDANMAYLGMDDVIVQIASEVDELVDAARTAVRKAKTEYRRVQPDAAEDECWAEFETLEDALDGS